MIAWLLPVFGSALLVGAYDLAKKAAVRGNPILPILFLVTLTGTMSCLAALAVSSGLGGALGNCTISQWVALFGKAMLVAVIWYTAFYAFRILPISIAAPIGAGSPLVTFVGAILWFGEYPTILQALGLLSVMGGYILFSSAGKPEGINWRTNRGIHLLLLGVVLEGFSSLYDKQLLSIMALPRDTVQLYFQLNLTAILGGALLICRWREGYFPAFRPSPAILVAGLTLILADYLFFYAVSVPDSRIAILSVLKRCGCLVTFLAGILIFHEKQAAYKFPALLLILLGILLIAIG